ncbi:MAG TPA: P27 family phage terminase small subunit [Sedimentisphaerales bacterium]|nr:P27 family phage terminase small subunit [Sedimentisphaerales bacterium]
MKKQIKAPSHLSKQAKDFFKQVLADYCLEDHHLKLLRLACEAWDEKEIARLIIKKEGMVFTDKFGQFKANPAVKIQNDARICFARLLREMQLDICPEEARLPRPNITKS